MLRSLRGEDPRVRAGGAEIALIGCFLAPHPPIMVPDVGGAELRKVESTVRAMREVRKKAAASHPDTIVLLSPHAPLLPHWMGVSLASSYEGTLAYFGAPNVVVEAEADEALAWQILESAAQAEIPASSTAAAGETLDLDHGSMVPLVYLLGDMERPCRLVVLSFSYLDLQAHVGFGRAVGEALLDADQRVLYVASSDLSHRLIPGAPAGYDPRGPEFDRLVAEHFKEGDWRGLLAIDPIVVTAAGECGYRSLAVLAGVVAAAQAAGLETHNHLLSYEGPFGVGYLVGEVEIAGETDTESRSERSDREGG